MNVIHAPPLTSSPWHVHYYILYPGPPPCHTLPHPCSSVNSAHSSASRSSGGSQTHSPGSSCRYRSLAQPMTTAAHRLSSVSSHDSGFISQDANAYSKPPSPMPSDITSQVFHNDVLFQKCFREMCSVSLLICITKFFFSAELLYGNHIKWPKASRVIKVLCYIMYVVFYVLVLVVFIHV